MDQRKQSKLLSLIASELDSPRKIKLVPPTVKAVQFGYVPSTNKYIYHIVLLNGEGIYGYRQGIFGELTVVDSWDWLSMGGIQLLAEEFGLNQNVDLSED